VTLRGLAASTLLCWSVATSAAAQAPPKKHALLVGLDRYLRSLSVPPLQFAQNDVKELKAVLEKRGFEVTMLLNSDASRARVLSELYRLADVVGEQDDFLLYYAGHGVRNRFPSRKTFWLTYDADLELLDATGIRLQHLLDYVQDIKAKRKLILLDHCFSGDVIVGPGGPLPGVPAAPGVPSPPPGGTGTGPAPGAATPGVEGGTRAVTGPVGLQRGAFPVLEIHEQSRARAEGLMIVSAARGGAFEVETLKHGIFTAALLKALDSTAADVNSDRRLSIDELTRYLDQETDRLAATIANAQQDVDVFGSVTNPQNWLVAENLSDPEQEVDQSFLRATDKLSNWEQKTWITQPTKERSWQALLDWVDKVKAGQQLPDDQQLLVTKVLKATLGSVAAFEQARANELNRFVESLPTPP
jgi:uncharacterized caspase-like protein